MCDLLCTDFTELSCLFTCKVYAVFSHGLFSSVPVFPVFFIHRYAKYVIDMTFAASRRSSVWYTCDSKLSLAVGNAAVVSSLHVLGIIDDSL